ncbi:Ribonuclease H-like superfamily, partial [Sesbania bispinosa]
MALRNPTNKKNQYLGRAVNLKWEPPPSGWVKVNSDGAFSHTCSIGACGGVVRDDWGHFMVGFAQNLRYCSILETELWGILRSLRIVHQRGWRKVIVEADSSQVVRFIEDGCPPTHASFSLVAQMWKDADCFYEIRLKNIPRDLNHLSDSLVKHGLELYLYLRVFYSIPPCAMLHYVADSS